MCERPGEANTCVLASHLNEALSGEGDKSHLPGEGVREGQNEGEGEGMRRMREEEGWVREGYEKCKLWVLEGKKGVRGACDEGK